MLHLSTMMFLDVVVNLLNHIPDPEIGNLYPIAWMLGVHEMRPKWKIKGNVHMVFVSRLSFVCNRIYGD